jgi:hypothetical protein
MEKSPVKPLCFLISVRILNQTFTEITCDPGKHDQTLTNRVLDFSLADRVFEGLHFTREDARKNYGKERFVTFGTLGGVLVVLVWTDRFPSIHVISMRRANRRERKAYQVLHH